MKAPKEISSWEFPDTDLEPDGWDMTSVPSLSKGNLNVLIDAHNELVGVVLALCEHSNIKFEGEK